MTIQYKWQEFLQRVSKHLIDTCDEDELEDFIFWHKEHQIMLENKWFGYAKATSDQIESAERHLGIQLPPDYKQFLLVTNGWESFRYYPLGLTDLLPIKEVDWFAQKDKRIGRLEQWIELQHNGRLETSMHVPEDHLRATLMIGESDGNECLLLNPLVKTKNGEWEAWSYGPEDGFDRVPSFWHLMQEYADFYVWSKD